MAAALACTISSARAADCSALRMTNSIVMNPIEDGAPLRIPVNVNGLSKSMVFDFNGDLNVISSDTNRTLKLKQLSTDIGPSYVIVPQVALGNAQGANVRFLVQNWTRRSVAQEGYRNEDIDLISRGMFRGDDIDLDFGARRLNFFSSDHCEGRVVYWPHQVLAVVPITVEGRNTLNPSGQVLFPVTLDGHRMIAMFNTSASYTMMDLAKAQYEFSFRPDPPVPLGLGTPNVDYPNRFSSLSFDGVTIQNPLIHLRPYNPGYTRGPNMIIGMDILRHLHIYAALDERKLYITEAGTRESALFPSQAPQTSNK